ncbi:hypothetical protein J0895_22685 [Phormidium pseudopriestleyi FRX01]|uniref:Uncharacterized protein n=1 Tax=Phormidium pseudopriestleyi FRX01 TaxID=1759528 RepID=A0ABS3FXK0_9CYAN|nr:hypothetical protein [Phormidium pseudopriestleyi]MBO0351835.1 hypothetical protein [Phormidium pseudopriestleyi FRX01]
MSSQELASQPTNPVSSSVPGADETPEASNSSPLQLICAVGILVLGFSGYMFSTWHQTLAQHSLAQQAQAETPVVEETPAIAPVEAEAQPLVTQPAMTATTAAIAPEVASTVPAAVPMVTEPAPTPGITDPATLTTLGQKLYEQIDSSWKSSPTFSSNLVYQVQVQQDGAIAGYDSLNKSAQDYLGETPLPELASNSAPLAENSTQPQAKFLVLLMPSGTLEISPWVGN